MKWDGESTSFTKYDHKYEKGKEKYLASLKKMQNGTSFSAILNC